MLSCCSAWPLGLPQSCGYIRFGVPSSGTIEYSEPPLLPRAVKQSWLPEPISSARRRACWGMLCCCKPSTAGSPSKASREESEEMKTAVDCSGNRVQTGNNQTDPVAVAENEIVTTWSKLTFTRNRKDSDKAPGLSQARIGSTIHDEESWMTVRRLLWQKETSKRQLNIIEQVKAIQGGTMSDLRKSSAPSLYVIGQLSLEELESYCVKYPGCMLFVQGLAGFNVVELSNGALQEAQRCQVEKICSKTGCTLFNLTANDCVKVGFDRVDQLFRNCIPNGHAKEVLNVYRACSFGSFAASVSRGKIKVEADGSATDGLIRSVDASIGKSVESLRSFEMRLYEDALALSRDSSEKAAALKAILLLTEKSTSRTPEEYLKDRTEGFGKPEAFVRLRSSCSAEITTAAYAEGGVLSGCVTPVYDDWTVHQALRIQAGLMPLDKESAENIDLHLAFNEDCIKFVYGTLETMSDYCMKILGGIEKKRHIALHDVGSDTGPDDFPACLMLMALCKYNGACHLELKSVGGEEKYRTLRTKLMQTLVPEIRNITYSDAPFIRDVSIPCPFIPVALVHTVSSLQDS